VVYEEDTLIRNAKGNDFSIKNLGD